MVFFITWYIACINTEEKGASKPFSTHITLILYERNIFDFTKKFSKIPLSLLLI